MRKFIIVIIVFLTGCFEEKNLQGLDVTEIITSLNLIIEPRCIYTPLKGLYFNTSSRVYDVEERRWKTTALPVISVRRESFEQDKIEKMMVLVDLGLFSIEERTLILKNRDYQGRHNLYYVGDFREDEEEIQSTYGVRFILTDYGKEYIKENDQYGNLGLCTGYHSVKAIGRPHKAYLFDAKTEKDIRRLHLSFNTEFILIDNFINNSKLQQAFPDIHEVISRHQAGYGLFSVNKREELWKVEPKSIMF